MRTLLISFPEVEKDLWDWFQEKKAKNEISASFIFRDALKEIKKRDDIVEEVDKNALKARVQTLKEALGNFHAFLEKKDLNEEWFNFNDKIMQKEIYAKKGIETIEIDNSKKKVENDNKDKKL